MRVDLIEVRFLELQKERFTEWFADKERVKNFILECMVLLTETGRKPVWDEFEKSGAWARMKEYANTRQQFEFRREYLILWKEIDTQSHC